MTLDLLPGQDAAALLRRASGGGRGRSRATVLTEVAAGRGWPRRVLAAHAAAGQALADAAGPGAAAGLGAMLNGWEVRPAGTEGYAKAEVTLGGDRHAGRLSSQTMGATGRARACIVVGEAADVTGWLGGYNFQWAWSSGWCAGMAA